MQRIEFCKLIAVATAASSVPLATATVRTAPATQAPAVAKSSDERAAADAAQGSASPTYKSRQDQANSILMKDPGLLSGEASRYTRLPGCHQEAWADAFFNIVRDAYDWIRAGAAPEAKSAALPTFEDGYRSTCVIDAILRSHVADAVWQAVSTAAYVRSDA